MPRISNSDVRHHVQNLEVFITNNKTIYSEFNGDLYVVYSYGPHFPMYAFDTQANLWFANTDKYSRTTSQHQSKANPYVDDMTPLDTDAMQRLVSAGSYVNSCADRILGAARV